MAQDEQKVQHSSEVFQSIGTKVDGLAPKPDDEAGEQDIKPVEEIESLCMNCHENGITRILLTSIPYFREVVIMSFTCDSCGLQNNEIQPAGTIQPKGTHYELRLTDLADLNRQVIKADSAVVKFIELDLEIPAGRGQLTNVEGLLSTVLEDLELGQEARKEQAPEVHAKIAEVITKARCMLSGEAFPFRVYVDDPAGNSFITPDLKDGVGKWEKRDYLRTSEQNAALGLADSHVNDAIIAEKEAGSGSGGHPGFGADGEIIPDEVYDFPASCPGCMHACVTHMKMVDIPHFKQVVLMSTVCEACGYRSNDVKTGGEIPEKGEIITLAVDDATDLARDILKSETCGLECPELQLQVNPGTLGGRFTTVEGLLTQVRNDLHSQIFEADGGQNGGTTTTTTGRQRLGGDSLSTQDRSQWSIFFDALDAAIAGHKKFRLVLTDPFASSFVQPLADLPANDPKITRTNYERTREEEEELGLGDMKVEGYEEKNPEMDGEGET